ncbi:hypothetical protein [Amycolatopsis sp. cg13]|uniref:hypothetical protein n=1 Tax=Amycolatopsis sp. cg13 TaxID=3238807 RepID=UPI0035267500
MYDLGQRFGIHRQTVGRHFKARGIDLTPGVDPKLLPQAAELYKAGWSLARIATKLDVSAETLWTGLTSAGSPCDEHIKAARRSQVANSAYF